MRSRTVARTHARARRDAAVRARRSQSRGHVIVTYQKQNLCILLPQPERGEDVVEPIKEEDHGDAFGVESSADGEGVRRASGSEGAGVSQNVLL